MTLTIIIRPLLKGTSMRVRLSWNTPALSFGFLEQVNRNGCSGLGPEPSVITPIAPVASAPRCNIVNERHESDADDETVQSADIGTYKRSSPPFYQFWS